MEAIDLLIEIGKTMKRKGLNSFNTSVLDLEIILIDEMNKEEK